MKNYRVWKYITKVNGDTEHLDCGNLPEGDVKRMLKGYKYDEMFGMWFSKAANIGYELEEI